MNEGLISELKATKDFFERSTNCLTEDDSQFRATEGSLTVAHQVAHAAQSIDWFIDGIISPQGFDMNFEKHWEDINQCTSLNAARGMFDKAMARAMETIRGMTEEQLMSPLPEGPVMGGAPKLAVVGGIVDHTAHHRGALSVYSRLLGKEPQMPYGE